MSFRRLTTAAAAALALSLALGSAGAALAQPTPAPATTGARACTALDPAVLQADEAVFGTVIQAVNAGGGYGAIRKHERALKTALTHAPSTPEQLAACGGLEAGWTNSAYPQMAFLLGALGVEHGRFEEAWKYLQQGLLMAPNDYGLSTEGSQALFRLNRFEEGLALSNHALEVNPGLDARSRAQLLRNRGHALGELNRFDEAEAAYRESLRYDPNNPVATNELEYIARRRRGAPPTASQTVNSQTGEVSAGDKPK